MKKDKKFETKKDFEEWLNNNTIFIVKLKTDSKDTITLHLDSKGIVLQGYEKSSIWKGSKVNTTLLEKGKEVLLLDGEVIPHKVKSIKQLPSKHNNDNRCQYCKVVFSLHRKCKRCGILLHKENPEYRCKTCDIQHTLESSKDNEYCDDCYINHIKK